jgi:hypothetical protein
MATGQSLRLSCKGLARFLGKPASGVLQCPRPVGGLQVKHRHHLHNVRIIRGQLKSALVVLPSFDRLMRLRIGLAALVNAIPVI